jgi:NAD(P)-dependent dehydrogenase (short-subunit alcohol dehydrogenase family)
MSESQRVVLVTGAASGIGAATARAFAACGDQLVLADIAADGLRGVSEGLPAAPGDVLAMPTDTTDVDSVNSLLAAAIDRFGHLDVVHANAGICPPERPLVDTSPEVVGRILSVNIAGTVNTLRAAVPHVRDGGAVIITASVSGLQAHAGAAVYAASKIALIGLGRALAVELAPRRIRVNMVCPGGVDTPLTRNAYGDDAERVIAGYREDNFMGRIAEPEDIAAAVLYLAQARHVTGVSLRVDGGDCLMGAV